MRDAHGQDTASAMVNPGIRAIDEMKDYGRVTREYQERELHRSGSDIRPLDFADFFVDPEVSAAHAARGQVVGPNPAAFANH